MLLVLLHVYVTCVNLLSFSLPIGIGGLQRIVIMTLPGLFV